MANLETLADDVLEDKQSRYFLRKHDRTFWPVMVNLMILDHEGRFPDALAEMDQDKAVKVIKHRLSQVYSKD